MDTNTESGIITEEVLEAQLRASFIREIIRPFRHAAEKLEYVNILDAHLHFASTPLGKQALWNELRPTLNSESIERSLSEIDELRNLFAAGEFPMFSGISDVRTTLHKVEIEGSTIYQDEGQPLVQTLKAIRTLRDFFAKRNSKTPTIWKSAILLFEDKLLELSFEAVFDENGAVRDNASSELHEVRREIVATSERLRNKLASLLKKYAEDDLLQDQIITQRDGRAVIPVKIEHKRRITGLIHSVSQTGQTVYIEPTETIDLNNELRSLEFAEQREIDRILRELTERLRKSVRPLLKSLEIAGHIEAVYAKARYATQIIAHTPRRLQQKSPGELQLKLIEARHPFLISKIGREKTIPFSIELDHSKHTLVLTGPNAGGKTVLLKTVGLLLLCSQAGLPIPAEPESTIPSVDGLFVDIGDSQSIADDLSTFSSHIRSLKTILEQTNEYSVILLDEIGSGTAPEEGGALAEAILEHLTKFAGFTIATTHYGRLAAFAESSDEAINGSMEFDQASLTPTYRFRINLPGSSHAFEIAERYELPRQIIKRARALAGGKTNRLEQLINSLSEKEQEFLQKTSELERELGKARFERLDFERQRDELAADKKKILSATSREAEELLSKANSMIEKAIREAREAIEVQHAEAVSLSDLRTKQKKELKSLADEVEAKTGAKVLQDQGDIPLTVGAKVKMIDNASQIGEVLSLNDKEAEVLFGMMKMKVKRSQLEAVSSATARREERKGPVKSSAYFDEMFQPKIDLRGKYGDEGVLEVEKFLSDASARNLSTVEILHGTGTGALGRRIHQYLRTSPLVASFHFADRTGGGMGVTIVELN